jgi:hypothetical protein
MREVSTLDELYTKQLTQRSVARAALHLGIQDMNVDTFTVLQDALTQYLERVCNVLASNVEHSGRSSMHVNILDATRSVEDCIPEGDWKGLEQFLSGDLDGSNNGWNAPLDGYDELIEYPLKTDDNVVDGGDDAMKQALAPVVVGGVADVASTIQDTKADQSLPSTLKRKRDDTEIKHTEKIIRHSGEDKEESTELKLHPSASYVPNFLPPFPPKNTFTHSIYTSKTIKSPFQAEAVRSSLVQMGHYWGSMTADSPKDMGKMKHLEIQVPTGTKSEIPADGADDKNARRIEDSIKPIARASTARVAKILEGSMGMRS